MKDDPIIKETREIREQIAAEHGYDIFRLGKYFMDKQVSEDRKVLRGTPRPGGQS